MKRYFVGGTPELEDLGYCGGGVTSSGGGGGILNRYGFRTATSGWVKLKLDIVHQSRAFMPNRCGLQVNFCTPSPFHHLSKCPSHLKYNL